MMEYRNSPKIQTRLPCGHAVFIADLQEATISLGDKAERLRHKAKMDRTAKLGEEFQPGEVMKIQNPAT